VLAVKLTKREGSLRHRQGRTECRNTGRQTETESEGRAKQQERARAEEGAETTEREGGADRSKRKPAGDRHDKHTHPTTYTYTYTYERGPQKCTEKENTNNKGTDTRKERHTYIQIECTEAKKAEKVSL